MLNTIFNRRTGRLLALAGLTATALAAQAADQATGPNGLMTFPNSYVVNQPVTPAKQGAARKAPAPQGMRAFKDPVTGELTGPTADQAAELEAATPATAVLRSKSLKSAPATIALPQGGVGITLDDSQASYSVAHKDASGNVVEECLPNKSAAKAAMRAKRKPANNANVKAEAK